MKTYEVKLVNGVKFKVENVTDTFETEKGMYFRGEDKEEVAFVTFNNLSHYKLVDSEPETEVTINQNLNWNAEEAIKFTELALESFMNGLKQQPKGGR